jgi:cbb3-type cytochrome oxidase maturation protein
MAILIILIIISMTVATGFLIAFLVNVKNNQYEDTYTPAVRILLDDIPQSTELENEKIK